jgi:murein DD-endopeptidase MepM/ murein hydrolase activator NlpD
MPAREPTRVRWIAAVDALTRRGRSRATVPWCSVGVGGPDPTAERMLLALVGPRPEVVTPAIDPRWGAPRALDLDGHAVPTSWPVDGLVTSGFGRRRSPWGGGMEQHPGIDIEAPYGTRVFATAEGEVSFAGRRPGYGLMVIVDHGRTTETVYAHLSALGVRRGQHVRDRDCIGAVGATGRATGPHLHYEVRVAERAVDPAPFLGDREVQIADPRPGARRPAQSEDVHS